MNTQGSNTSALIDYAAEAFPPVSGWQWRFKRQPETLPAETDLNGIAND